MAETFVGEIRMFGGDFAPVGWAFCSGQLLSIEENSALFALIGTTYGGDGQATFAVPDLRGRVPVHQGQGPGLSSYVLGQMGGTERVTLISTQLPAHNHTLAVSSASGTGNPTNAVFASIDAGSPLYAPSGPPATAASGVIANAGGSQPHDNVMPFQCVNFIIALEGIFPSRN